MKQDADINRWVVQHESHEKILSRPSSARYSKFINRLREADQHLATMPPLSASLGALSAVLQFLNEDEDLSRHSVASVALHRLMMALHDTGLGTKPEMFFSKSFYLNGKSGRRTGTMFHQIRGILLSAMHELFLAGMSRHAAAKCLEKILAEKGVRDDKGKQITVRLLIQWRKQHRNTAPPASDEAFDIHQKLTREARRDPPTLDSARETAEHTVADVAHWISK